jgi:hypothetical protein
MQQRAMAGLALAVLSLIAWMLIANPRRAAVVAAVALVVAGGALALTISALSGAKRARTRRPRGAVAGAVLGIIGFLFSGVALLTFLIFSAQFQQYYTCMNAATTSTEQQACQTQLDNSITNVFGGLGAKLPGPASLVGRLVGPRVDVDTVAVRVVGLVNDERGQRPAVPGLRAGGVRRQAVQDGEVPGFLAGRGG